MADGVDRTTDLMISCNEMVLAWDGKWLYESSLIDSEWKEVRATEIVSTQKPSYDIFISIRNKTLALHFILHILTGQWEGQRREEGDMVSRWFPGKLLHCHSSEEERT